MEMKNYNIIISEPWDFTNSDGSNIISGQIIRIVNEEIAQRKRLKQWVTNHPKIIWRIRANGSQHINSLSEPPFMSIEISLNNISNNHDTNYYNYSDSFRKCMGKSF